MSIAGSIRCCYQGVAGYMRTPASYGIKLITLHVVVIYIYIVRVNLVSVTIYSPLLGPDMVSARGIIIKNRVAFYNAKRVIAYAPVIF